MEFRSTNAAGWTHHQGDLVSNVASSHGIRLSGGSTGGIVESVGDDTNISLNVRGKGTGAVVLGNSSSPVAVAGAFFPLGAVTITATDSSVAITSTHVNLNSSRIAIGSAASTTTLSGIKRHRIDFTVPVLSSGGSAESTLTLTGATTNSIYVFQPRQSLNSSVVGVHVDVWSSVADEVVLLFSNNSLSTLSGSTMSGYLLQFLF